MEVILDFIINNIAIIATFIALFIPSPAGKIKKIVIIIIEILKKLKEKKIVS